MLMTDVTANPLLVPNRTYVGTLLASTRWTDAEVKLRLEHQVPGSAKGHWELYGIKKLGDVTLGGQTYAHWQFRGRWWGPQVLLPMTWLGIDDPTGCAADVMKCDFTYKTLAYEDKMWVEDRTRTIKPDGKFRFIVLATKQINPLGSPIDAGEFAMSQGWSSQGLVVEPAPADVAAALKRLAGPEYVQAWRTTATRTGPAATLPERAESTVGGVTPVKYFYGPLEVEVPAVQEPGPVSTGAGSSVLPTVAAFLLGVVVIGGGIMVLKGGPKKALARENPIGGTPTVSTFLVVLSSKLTQWDQQVAKRERHVNIYRLGHLLGAKQRVEAEVATYLDRSDPEAMTALAQSIMRHFSDVPPRRNVLKQMQAWTVSGKSPTLLRENPIRYDSTVNHRGLAIHVHASDNGYCADYRALDRFVRGAGNVVCASTRGEAVSEAKRRIDRQVHAWNKRRINARV